MLIGSLAAAAAPAAAAAAAEATAAAAEATAAAFCTSNSISALFLQKQQQLCWLMFRT
jgi:hypothetical protein